MKMTMITKHDAGRYGQASFRSSAFSVTSAGVCGLGH